MIFFEVYILKCKIISDGSHQMEYRLCKMCTKNCIYISEMMSHSVSKMENFLHIMSYYHLNFFPFESSPSTILFHIFISFTQLDNVFHWKLWNRHTMDMCPVQMLYNTWKRKSNKLFLEYRIVTNIIYTIHPTLPPTESWL